MAYKYIKQLADRSNYGGARSASQIKYIVIHYTGNDGDSSASNARYFQKPLPPEKKASAHYFVDSQAVYQSVCDLSIAWSVGGSKYSNCEQTGGGKLYKIATNANSLNIELCDDQKNGQVMATPQTIDNAIALCAELMKKYSIDLDHVIRHFDVTGKQCPSYFIEPKAWQSFKSKLKKALASSQNKANAEQVSNDLTEGTKVPKNQKYRVIAKDGLNVRAGAGTKYKKLFALALGDAFSVDRFEGDWAHGYDNLNREGYAFKKWLELSD